MNNFGQQYMGGATNYMPQDPTAMYQQRLNSMAQQVMGQGQPNGMGYGYPQQMQMQNQMGMMGAMQSQNFNVRVVTGYEEAMASNTPLDGSISILIDRLHETIYTKQLNMNDGTPLVKRYKLAEVPNGADANVENHVEYVEKAEFNELKNRFNELWGAIADDPLPSKNEPETNKKEVSK